MALSLKQEMDFIHQVLNTLPASGKLTVPGRPFNETDQAAHASAGDWWQENLLFRETPDLCSNSLLIVSLIIILKKESRGLKSFVLFWLLEY